MAAQRGHVHHRNMIGTSAATGKLLSGIDHLRQSITDILTTPIGSRVMRRDYGSRLFQLVDAPLNLSTGMDLMAATVEALEIWEPRIRVTKVTPSVTTAGGVQIAVEGEYLPDGQIIVIDGIVVK